MFKRHFLHKSNGNNTLMETSTSFYGCPYVIWVRYFIFWCLHFYGIDDFVTYGFQSQHTLYGMIHTWLLIYISLYLVKKKINNYITYLIYPTCYPHYYRGCGKNTTHVISWLRRICHNDISLEAFYMKFWQL